MCFCLLQTLLNSKLSDIHLKLDWVERLDLTTSLEPIVDSILNGKEDTEPQYKIETPGDRIVDDLQRETLFYRQAQSAIIEGLARLKTLGIPTKRPEDYFAQMAKSDDHMLKVIFCKCFCQGAVIPALLFVIGQKASSYAADGSGKMPES